MSEDLRRCKRCDIIIPSERIEALPDTEVCVKCSEEVGGEWDTYVVPGDTAKKQSLKHNYSQFGVVRKRKRIYPKTPPRE